MDNLFSTYVVEKFMLNQKLVLIDLVNKFLSTVEQNILKAIKLSSVNPYDTCIDVPHCYNCGDIYTIEMYIPDSNKIFVSHGLPNFALEEKYGNQSFMNGHNISNVYYARIVIKLNKVKFYEYAKKAKPNITEEELKCFEYTG
jgi:hypothetical protein